MATQDTTPAEFLPRAADLPEAPANVLRLIATATPITDHRADVLGVCLDGNCDHAEVTR